jgi:hypothetical protein
VRICCLLLPALGLETREGRLSVSEDIADGTSRAIDLRTVDRHPLASVDPCAGTAVLVVSGIGAHAEAAGLVRVATRSRPGASALFSVHQTRGTDCPHPAVIATAGHVGARDSR